MCEANAYYKNQEQEELLLESVDIVKPEATNSWIIENIFGEQKIVKGRILEMKLVDHRIVFGPI